MYTVIQAKFLCINSRNYVLFTDYCFRLNALNTMKFNIAALKNSTSLIPAYYAKFETVIKCLVCCLALNISSVVFMSDFNKSWNNYLLP